MVKHLSYSKIEKYIYIGTNICCRKHFNELLNIGISADIDLEEEKMDKPSTGITVFLWLPVIDFQAPSQIKLHIAAHVIDTLVQHKQKCYVHCHQGQGRAPTVVAAYYVLKGMTVKQALDKIRKIRPLAKPNSQQVSALNIFAKNISLYRK